jgi:hypothetical protein
MARSENENESERKIVTAEEDPGAQCEIAYLLGGLTAALLERGVKRESLVPNPPGGHLVFQSPISPRILILKLEVL